MKITTKEIIYSTEMHTCKNCGHVFKGKICNHCGEKIFSEKQLTTKHFFQQVIDFFYHWESKVLKTIKLNFIKPGFVTKENLRGVRAPYAKPVQLYLVVAFAFFIIVGRVGQTDYIPASDDHHYYGLSEYPLFKWAKPIDAKVEAAIDSLWVKKGREIESGLQKRLNNNFVKQGKFMLYGRGFADSINIPTDQLNIISFRQMEVVRNSLYNNSVGPLGKVLIFILLPVFAALFFLMFFKKIKYYGAALIFATHFMVYNLCVYSLNCLISIAPGKIYKPMGGWVMKPLRMLFYNDTLAPFSTLIFGEGFEFFHIVFWMPWLFIAIKRLFNTPWWKNLIISYICCKVFYYLIFGVLKKILITFTIWTMHV